MKTTSFINAQIVTPSGIVEGSLVCAGETITQIAPNQTTEADEVIDVQGGYMLPGFIDTQVNGGGGVLFNDETTADGVAAIGRAHRPYGTTGYLPTLISDELQVIDRAMRAVEAAIEQGAPGVLGIHIEGPFISKEKKGIHNPELFRTLDADSKALLKSLKRGKTLVTLAPERCAPEDIAELKAAGVVIAAGHTNATYDQTVEALKAGVSGFTHLFNAMTPMLHRAPGVVGAALENLDNFSGLIMDGHHVDWPVFRVALRTRPANRFMLVTDAMPTVGSKTKTFVLNGQTIYVKDGVCVGPDGTLAGSDLDMATAVKNAVVYAGASITDAAIMAAAAPAEFLGLHTSRGSLVAGQRADIVWLDRDLTIQGTFIGALQNEPVAA